MSRPRPVPAFIRVVRHLHTDRQARAVLESAPALLAEVLDNLDVLVVVVDLAGRIRRGNRAFREFTGLVLRDPLGPELREWVPGAAQDVAERTWAAAQVTENSVHAVHALRGGDGTARPVCWSVKALRDIQGRPGALLCTGAVLAEGQPARSAAPETLDTVDPAAWPRREAQAGGAGVLLDG